MKSSILYTVVLLLERTCVKAVGHLLKVTASLESIRSRMATELEAGK